MSATFKPTVVVGGRTYALRDRRFELNAARRRAPELVTLPDSVDLGRRDFFARLLPMILGAALCPTLARASRSFPNTTTDYLEYSGALAGPLNFSMMGWAKLNSVAVNNTLMTINSTTDRYQQCLCVATAVWAYSYDGVTFPAAMSAASLSTGTWFHWGAIFRTGGNSRSVYKDGTKTTDTNSCNPSWSGLTMRTTLGLYRGSVTQQQLNGYLAHVGLWSTEITDAEMTSGAKGLSPLHIRPAALVDYWPCVGTAGGNESGRKGNVFTQTGTVSNSSDQPLSFQ